MRLVKFRLHLLLVGLSAIYFLASGIHGALRQSWDFAPVYSGARCLLHGCNPYSIAQVKAEFLRGGGQESTVEQVGGWESVPPVYPPSTLAALVPMALLRFPTAVLLWSVLNASLLIAAVILVLSICPQRHKWFGAVFASFFLIAGIEGVKDGQPAAFAVAALIAGAVFFLRRRRLLLAACLIMLSLAVKPQIGGLAVLYFLADKGVRRYATLALCGALALLLAGSLVLFMRPASRNWASDLRGNVATSLARGNVNDPANPATGEIHLDAIASVLAPDRRIAGSLALSAFLLLLAAWAFACLRRRPDAPPQILSLSALLVLTLMPVYHRQPDAAVLLLSVPALFAILEMRPILGTAMAFLTIPGCVSIPAILNGYLSVHAPALRESFLHSRLLIFLVLSDAGDLPSKFQHLLDSKLMFLLVLRQQPLALLLLACLYVVAVFTIREPRPSSHPQHAHALSQQVAAGDPA